MLNHANTGESRRQVPALDGLRAIAILGVLIFHICPGALPGGFSGVDVFFVLSGFLITSIIYEDINNRHFSFKEFYLRRIQRLMPNCISAIAATLLLWWIFLPQGLETTVATHGIWTLFYLSNVYARTYIGDYWGDGAEWTPLTHFWSLGVEEQFYIVFPVLFLLSLRFFPRYFRAIIGIVFVGIFTSCLYKTFSRPASAFYLLENRAWELLAGSLLAVCGLSLYSTAPRAISRLKGEISGFAGLLLIIFSFIFSSEKAGFPGWLALLPVAGSALLIYSALSGRSLLSHLFEKPLLSGIGKISYSLYLWHWPLIVFGKYQAEYHGVSQQTGAILGGIAGIAAAIAAYFFIERPLRKRGPGRSKRLLVTAGIFVASLALCLVVKYLPQPPSPFNPIISSLKLYDISGYAGDGAKIVPKRGHGANGRDVIYPEYDASRGFDESVKKTGINRFYGNPETPQVVVWGSSHALMYAKLMDTLCKEKSISVSFWAWRGKAVYEEKPKGFLQKASTVSDVFYADRKQMLEKWKPALLFVIDRVDRDGKSEAEQIEDLTKLLEETKALGTTIVVAAQVPALQYGERENLRAMVRLKTRPGQGLPAIFPDQKEEERKRIHAAMESLAAGNPRLKIIRPDRSFYNPDGSLRYVEGKEFLYADDDHLTDAGAEAARPLFSEVLDMVAGKGAKQP